MAIRERTPNRFEFDPGPDLSPRQFVRALDARIDRKLEARTGSVSWGLVSQGCDGSPNLDPIGDTRCCDDCPPGERLGLIHRHMGMPTLLPSPLPRPLASTAGVESTTLRFLGDPLSNDIRAYRRFADSRGNLFNGYGVYLGKWNGTIVAPIAEPDDPDAPLRDKVATTGTTSGTATNYARPLKWLYQWSIETASPVQLGGAWHDGTAGTRNIVPLIGDHMVGAVPQWGLGLPVGCFAVEGRGTVRYGGVFYDTQDWLLCAENYALAESSGYYNTGPVVMVIRPRDVDDDPGEIQYALEDFEFFSPGWLSRASFKGYALSGANSNNLHLSATPQGDFWCHEAGHRRMARYVWDPNAGTLFRAEVIDMEPSGGTAWTSTTICAQIC